MRPIRSGLVVCILLSLSCTWLAGEEAERLLPLRNGVAAGRPELAAHPFQVRGRAAGRGDLTARAGRLRTRSARLQDGKAYDHLEVDGWTAFVDTPGRPELPLYRSEVRIPDGATVRMVIDRVTWRDLPGEFMVAPVQHPIPDLTGHDDSTIPFAKDEQIYAADSFGDQPPVRLVEQVIVRGRAFAIVEYQPVAFNPARKRLRAAGEVEWRLDYDLPADAAAARASVRPEPASELDIRPEADPAPAIEEPAIEEPAVEPQAAAEGGAATPGACDYLIIAADTYVAGIERFAQWKRRTGLETFVARYPTDTGSGEAAVKTYITNAYTAGNKRLAYVLIVGDHEHVPACQIIGHSYYGSDHVWHSDKQYACVDGTDNYPDLAIGRFSADNATQLNTLIDKVLGYEQAPPEGDWLRHVLVAAQNESGRWFEEDVHRVADFLGGDFDFFGAWNGYTGAQGEATDPFNKGYTTHVVVNGYLDPYSTSSFSLRLTPPSPTPAKWKANGTGSGTQVSQHINNGVGFVMHRDHGSSGGWGTPGYSTSNVSALVNGAKLPVVFSINCETGWFDTKDAFGEAWVRNANGGAVALVGHQRVSWSGPNDTLHVGVMDSIWDDYSSYTNAAYPPSRRLGELVQRACATISFGSVTDRMFNLLGDPAMFYRTEVPVALAATHPTTVTPGAAASFDVVVTRGGAAFAGATVTLVDDDDFHVATTDAQGKAHFAFTPVGTGQLDVTATQAESIPYRGGIIVTDATTLVTVAATDASAHEDGDPAVFTISRISRTGVPVTTGSLTVNLSGSADFASVPASITFAAGESQKAVTLVPVDDLVVEGDEAAALTVAAGTGYAVGCPSSAEAVITDNEPVLTVSASDGTGSEPGRSEGGVTWRISRSAGGTSRGVTVNLSWSGSASTADTATRPTTAVLAAGAATVDVTLAVSDDSVVESAETLTLTLNGGTGYGVGSSNAATATIHDDEAPVVTVAVTDSSCSEASSGDGVFTITRQGNLAAALPVTYALTGTATNGTDYQSRTGSVTLAAGSATATVSIDPIDDTVFDPAETAILTLQTGAGYSLGATTAGTITITDNDLPTITITATDATAVEGAGGGLLTISAPEDVTANLTITYKVSGTAAAGDYTALPGSAVIAAGQASVTVPITAIADGVAEGAETVVVTLSAGTGYTVAAAPDDAATVTISDAAGARTIIITVVDTLGAVLSYEVACQGGTPQELDATHPEALFAGLAEMLDSLITFALAGPDAVQ